MWQPDAMTRHSLFVRHVLKPGHETAFDDLVAATLPAIQQHEPRTLLYLVHTVSDQPLQRVFYELYTDRQAFEEHEQQDHVRRFLDARTQHVESIIVDGMTPADGSVGLR